VCGVPGPVRACAVCAFCASRGLHAVALAVAGLFRGAGVLSALVAPASKVSRRTTAMMRCGTRNWTTKSQARVSSTTPKKKAHSQGKGTGEVQRVLGFQTSQTLVVVVAASLFLVAVGRLSLRSKRGEQRKKKKKRKKERKKETPTKRDHVPVGAIHILLQMFKVDLCSSDGGLEVVLDQLLVSLLNSQVEAVWKESIHSGYLHVSKDVNKLDLCWLWGRRVMTREWGWVSSWFCQK